MNPWHNRKPTAGSKTSAVSSPTSRWLAVQAIQTFNQQGIFVSKTLDELFQEHRIPTRERRLATELAAETIRRRLTLDTILSQYVVRPRESVEDDLWLLLQLGVCQLVCLQHIPPHAAVHETVKLCETSGKPRAKGFINGTLRSIEREIIRETNDEDTANERGPTLENLDFAQLNSHLWPILVPRQGEHRVVLLEHARKIFAAPQTEPLEYISQVTSLPSWLLDRWALQFPDPNQILRIGLWFSTPGHLSLRVNTLQSTRDDVLNMLESEDISAVPGRLPEAIVLRSSTAVVDLPGFSDGEFSVQDESAMAATELLAPQPGESILDLCAAPGGKSCHIAERLAGTGRVLACDVSEERLRTITHNVKRLQLQNVETWSLSENAETLPAGPFDAALVDVPCSNTGVLGKRPEARWRLLPASFEELIPLQKQLLNRAIDQVVSGGRIVYSTCSIDREENEDVVRAVLESRNDIRMISETLHQPGSPADGGYQALLVKS